MRTFRKRLLAGCAAAMLLLLQFSACTTASKEERISDETLETLREKYPYDNMLSPIANMSFESMQTWESVAELNISAVAVVHLTDDWQLKQASISPFGEASDGGAAVNSMTGIFHPAVVERVLWGGDDLEKDAEVLLNFGSTILTKPEYLARTYQSGERYVCFLFKTQKTAFESENAWTAEKTETFYLTDENVLIASSNLIACIDECSGMYLDAFEKLLPTVIGEAPKAMLDLQSSTTTE